MKWTASKFARAADTTVRTLRHYRQLGLLVPTEKNDRNQNVYTTHELKKLHTIQLLQSLGLSLKEIKAKLEEPGYSFESMLDVQKEMFIRKKASIESSLALIERVQSMQQEADAEMFMLLMNSMRYEQSQREIVMDYFSDETVEKLFPTEQTKQKELDRLSLHVLVVVDQAIKNGYGPAHEKVQQQLEELQLNKYVSEWSIDDQKADELNERLQPYLSMLPDDILTFLTEAIEASSQAERKSNT